MKRQDTTGERPRSADDIDFREIEELVRSAKDGDEKAKKEIEDLGKILEDADVGKELRELVGAHEEFVRDIVVAYIETFNQIHETYFVSLDEIKKFLETQENTPEISFESVVDATTARPEDFVHTLGRLTDKVFSNEVTLKEGQTGKFGVPLGKERTVSVYASVNYDNVIKDLGPGAKVPELTGDDREILDGIISNLYAGNKVMTYKMIYRSISGKVDEGDIYVPDEIYDMIDKALDHFRGVLMIDNSPEVKERGGKIERISFDGPILHYDRLQRATINGKEIDGEREGIIFVYDFPSLYRFAQANRGEIDTRDIKLLNVPKFNNTLENRRLKRYLYYRVIQMRSDYERNVLYRKNGKMTCSRKILFSSVFEYIGTDVKDRQRKYKIIQKMETILNYWKQYGLISNYTKTKKLGSKEYDGVEIGFVQRIAENKTE